MKALIVVILINTVQGSNDLVRRKNVSCWSGRADEAEIKVEETNEKTIVECSIYLDQRKEGECFVSSYGLNDYFLHNGGKPQCFFETGDSELTCYCNGDNCNANLETFYEALKEVEISTYLRHTRYIECFLQKIEALRPTEATTDSTATIATTEEGYYNEEESTTDSEDDGGITDGMETSPATEDEEITVGGAEFKTTENTKDTLTKSTNSTVATSPSSLQHMPNGEQISSYFGWMIGSLAFNVLLVVTIAALIIVIIKMKKDADGKQKAAKDTKHAPPPTDIKIEKPTEKKEPSVVHASTEPKADQGEADVNNKTGTQDDLDTTGSTTLSDSTGPEAQVQISVRGFKKN